MQCTVFRLYSDGFRRTLPPAPAQGSLQFGRFGHAYRLSARLVQGVGGDEVLPTLWGAQVIAVSHRGLAISGYESIPRRSNPRSSSDRYKQVWWCRVDDQLTRSEDLAGMVARKLAGR